MAPSQLPASTRPQLPAPTPVPTIEPLDDSEHFGQGMTVLGGVVLAGLAATLGAAMTDAAAVSGAVCGGATAILYAMFMLLNGNRRFARWEVRLNKFRRDLTDYNAAVHSALADARVEQERALAVEAARKDAEREAAFGPREAALAGRETALAGATAKLEAMIAKVEAQDAAFTEAVDVAEKLRAATFLAFETGSYAHLRLVAKRSYVLDGVLTLGLEIWSGLNIRIPLRALVVGHLQVEGHEVPQVGIDLPAAIRYGGLSELFEVPSVAIALPEKVRTRVMAASCVHVVGGVWAYHEKPRTADLQDLTVWFGRIDHWIPVVTEVPNAGS